MSVDPQTRAKISAALKRYYAAHPKAAPKKKGGKSKAKAAPKTNFAKVKKKATKRKKVGFKAAISTTRLRKDGR